MAAYWENAAHSANDMFSKYKYLIVNLVFSGLGFWSGNFFLIALFPDHCLLVPFYTSLCIDYPVKRCENSNSLWRHVAKSIGSMKRLK